MSGEFKHRGVGGNPTGELPQDTYESVTHHVLDGQATGDILYASSATQLSRLAIGATNKVLTVIGGVPTWQSTLAGLTLTSPTINGSIATAGLTLPAVTLGGNIAAGGYDITGLDDLILTAASFVSVNVDNSFFSMAGGTSGASATIGLWGRSHATTPGQLGLYTPNAALAQRARLIISGVVDTAVATCSALTWAGMAMSDHLTLHITDTDGTTEGDIWYDASEDKLKFKTAAGVETVTSA